MLQSVVGKSIGCSSIDCYLRDNKVTGGCSTPCKCISKLNKAEIEFVQKKLTRLRMLEESIKEIIDRTDKCSGSQN